MLSNNLDCRKRRGASRASMDDERSEAGKPCARVMIVRAPGARLLHEAIETQSPRREVATSRQPGRHGCRTVDGVGRRVSNLRAGARVDAVQQRKAGIAAGRLPSKQTRRVRLPCLAPSRMVCIAAIAPGCNPGDPSGPPRFESLTIHQHAISVVRYQWCP
jgi:hypothetical protein